MELTGKAKIDFEKWYLIWVFKEKTYLSLRFSEEQILENWESLHNSEKYSVLVDFFDTKDMALQITKEDSYFSGYINTDWMATDKERFEVRNELIDVTNEIYNNL